MSFSESIHWLGFKEDDWCHLSDFLCMPKTDSPYVIQKLSEQRTGFFTGVPCTGKDSYEKGREEPQQRVLTRFVRPYPYDVVKVDTFRLLRV